MHHSNKSGDTIIEVVLSITIFSLVCYGIYNLLVSTISSSRRSLDISVARNLVDSQATSLRFIQNAYISTYSPGLESNSTPAKQWKNLKNYISEKNPRSNVIDFGPNTTTCPDIPLNSFIMNPKDSSFIPYSEASIKKATGLAELKFDEKDDLISYGIWIEAARSSTNPPYIDFYIRSCWNGDNDIPVIIGTIVRLYDTQE